MSAPSSSSPSSVSGIQLEFITEELVTVNGEQFRRFTMRHPARSTVQVYSYGAHVSSWKILGTEMLHMSETAVFSHGKAIRGGIPVVFPQFGPGKLPQHGFARNKEWVYDNATINKATGDVSSVFVLKDDAETRAVWNYKFTLRLTLVLKATSLSAQLTVVNEEKSAPFDFTALLHTYLHVDDITKTTVSGLEGLRYVDKVKQTESVESSSSVVFSGEVDRVYIGGGSKTLTVNDGGNGEVLVKSTNFNDVVVWNPWIEKAKSMADFDDSGYTRMVCVEPGSVHTPVTLKAQETWTAAMGLSLKINNESKM